MELTDNYFIKEEYKTNPVKTFSAKPQTYWNEQRIYTSFTFQYSIYQYALNTFQKNHFKSLLDIGSGPGTKINILFNNSEANITVVDQPGMKDIIQKNCPIAKYIPWDLEKTLNTDRKYDLITCFDVIEHLENPDSIFQTIRQNLAKKGIAILSTPDRDIRRGRNCFTSPNQEHVREWNKNEFNKYIKSHGYTVIKHFNFPNKKLHPLLLNVGSIISKLFTPTKWYAQVIVIKI